MILAADAMVNQAAKWNHMLGGQSAPGVTFRGIINRGGEQGAQHSQALHSWYAHIPGLRVVMPSTPTDARDLLIAATLCDDPVLYIDDRWLYEVECPMTDVREPILAQEGPVIRRTGSDATLVGVGYSAHLCGLAADLLEAEGISVDVIDLRVLNPLRYDLIAASVEKTGRLVAVDGGWRTCGMAGEVIAGVCERVDPRAMKTRPLRLTLPDAPAPTSRALESLYYISAEDVVAAVRAQCSSVRPVA